MFEVPHSGEDHRDAVLVGGLDDFLVPDGTAGLNHRCDAMFGGFVQAVAERKEGVRRQHGSGERQLRF